MPTYQRRDVVLESIRALEHLEFNAGFEVIVVVDGSTDGTAEALRRLATTFPFKIVEQPNRGASVARNHGATIARGEVLLFLDDDMEAHPQLLVEHDRSHSQGADAVIGHIPLHPKSPRNFLSYGVGRWAEERVHELSAQEGALPFREIMTGQLSIARQTFFEVGGFDTNFTRDGSFGNEDLDFGLRLQEGGYQIIFNPAAISWQRYVVTPRQFLRQYRQAGRADVLFARIHPEQATNIFSRSETWMDRLVWRWFRSLIRLVILTLLDGGLHHPKVTYLFSWLVTLEYYQGVREAGGIPQVQPLRVLCYHAIADLTGHPITENYGIPPKQFQQQMDVLKRAGFHFIDAQEFLCFLQGKAGVPRRAILLTFDDCYTDLLSAAWPILKERGIPAIAFAVSGRLGATNDWDKKYGAPQLQLLDADQLRQLAQVGVVIGAHSRTHPQLIDLSVEELPEEIAGSVNDLEAIGLERPCFFAYPHGVYDQRVQQATRAVGLQAAFTVKPGLVQPHHDPFQLPRIEILRRDAGWKFLWKVVLADHLIGSRSR